MNIGGIFRSIILWGGGGPQVLNWETPGPLKRAFTVILITLDEFLHDDHSAAPLVVQMSMLQVLIDH